MYDLWRFNVAEITNKQFPQKVQTLIQSAFPGGITLENEGLELTAACIKMKTAAKEE